MEYWFKNISSFKTQPIIYYIIGNNKASYRVATYIFRKV